MTNYNKLCIICLNYPNNEKISSCSSGHITCNECLQTFMEVQSTSPDIVTKCSSDKCNKPLKMNIEIQDKMLQKFIKQICDLTETIQKLGKDKTNEIKKNSVMTIKTLFQDLHQLIRSKYANDLVLKCPNCATAFIDFDGCLALTCENCKAGFCALCLENCGDAHNHLQQIHGVVHDDSEKSNFKKANYKRTTDELIKITEMITMFIVDLFKDLSCIHEYKNLDSSELMKLFLGTIHKGYNDYQCCVPQPQSRYDDDINQFNFWDKIREKHLMYHKQEQKKLEKEIKDQFDEELKKCKQKLQDQFNEDSYKYKIELQRQLDEEIYKHEKETEEQIKKYEKQILGKIQVERTKYEKEICEQIVDGKIKYQNEIKILKQNLENEQQKNKILEKKESEYLKKEMLYNKYLEKERLEKKQKDIEEREKIVRLKREHEIEKELERLKLERLEKEHEVNKHKEHGELNKLNKEYLSKKQKEIEEREKIVRLKRQSEIEKEHINRVIYK